MRRRFRPLLPTRRWARRLARRKIPAEYMRTMQRANQLYESERYLQAYELYADLARRMEKTRQSLPLSAQFHLQAGLCLFQSGEEERGIGKIKDFLALLEKINRPALSKRLLRSAHHRLHALGAVEASRMVEMWSEAHFSEILGQSEPKTAAHTFPPKCPQCGATVLPDEASIQGAIPCCAYCGSVLVEDLDHRS